MFSQRTYWKLSPNPFAVALQKAQASGRSLLDLTISNPTTCGLENKIELSLNETRYAPEALGLYSARQAVATYYRELSPAVEADAEAIILTTSTSEAYTYVFRLLCDPGDEVMVTQPSYPLFEYLAEIQDVRLRAVPLIYDHGWQLDLHSMSAAVGAKTRAILLVNPNNPTGSFIRPGELEALNKLCQERDLALIADEVFLDYSFRGTHISMAANREALTFTLSGLSKIAGLPHMKVAWLAVSGPETQVQEALRRLEVIADTYLSLSTPMQLAIPTMLATRQSFQERIKRRLTANLGELDSRLGTGHAITRLDVEGGWYATLRIPAMGSDEDAAIRLLQEKCVIVHPGHFFDFRGEGHLIVSLLTPTDEFCQGMERLLSFFSQRES